MVVILVVAGIAWYLAMQPAAPVTPTPIRAQHNSILITGNNNFIPANGVSGGDGSASNPHIIENWAIDASDGNGISIRDTTAYFVIRNCLIENGYSLRFHFKEGMYSSGIYLKNVVNGILNNNICSNNNWFGIYLFNSSKISINNNNCSNNSYSGIFIASSSSNIITNNICSNNYNVLGSTNGIYVIRDSKFNTITNNICDKNSDSGICLYVSSSHNIISNNTCRSNVNCGIYIRDSNNNIVSHNRSFYNLQHGIKIMTTYGVTLTSKYNILANNNFSNNLCAGIKVELSDYNTITGNIVENNSSSPYAQSGITLWNSSQNVITLNYLSTNRLLDGKENNSYDDNINSWDNNGFGNYWSDWQTPDMGGDGIVDDKRPIPGGNSVDKYPLIIKYVPSITFGFGD